MSEMHNKTVLTVITYVQRFFMHAFAITMGIYHFYHEFMEYPYLDYQKTEFLSLPKP